MWLPKFAEELKTVTYATPPMKKCRNTHTHTHTHTHTLAWCVQTPPQTKQTTQAVWGYVHQSYGGSKQIVVHGSNLQNRMILKSSEQFLKTKILNLKFLFRSLLDKTRSEKAGCCSFITTHAPTHLFSFTFTPIQL